MKFFYMILKMNTSSSLNLLGDMNKGLHAHLK
ncbi:hypothetical protein MALU111345_19935 [Marinicrinis lubricantis]